MTAQASSPHRPVLRLENTPTELALDLCALIVIAWQWLLAFQTWAALPGVIPTHFGASGPADDFGPKWTLVLLPAASIVFDVAFTWLRRMPHIYNYAWPITEQNAQRQYALARLLMSWLKLELVSLFAFLEWTITQAALKHIAGLNILFLPVTLGVIFGTAGIFLLKAYQAR